MEKKNYKELYEQALERAKQINNTPYTAHWDVMKEVIDELFPELHESEDERIRKEIIELVMQPSWKSEQEFHRRKELVAWLEKQGEQKPADNEMIEILHAEYEKGRADAIEEIQNSAWSEEDGNHFKSILSTLECCKAQFPNSQAVVEAYNADAEWLKSLKDRVQPQPKQGWSEEDELTRNALINLVEMYYGGCIDKSEKNRLLDWLKSLRPQSHWKPSDEQMEAVRLAAEIGTANNSWAMGILKGMYQDLKKLREE